MVLLNGVGSVSDAWCGGRRLGLTDWALWRGRWVGQLCEWRRRRRRLSVIGREDPRGAHQGLQELLSGFRGILRASTTHSYSILLEEEEHSRWVHIGRPGRKDR